MNYQLMTREAAYDAMRDRRAFTTIGFMDGMLVSYHAVTGVCTIR